MYICILRALAIHDADPVLLCDFGLDETFVERQSTQEILGLTPDEIRSSLKSIVQCISNASTDDSNQRAVQLVNHEFFRDVRPNREDYKNLIGREREREKFEVSKMENLFERFKAQAAEGRTSRLKSLGVKQLYIFSGETHNC